MLQVAGVMFVSQCDGMRVSCLTMYVPCVSALECIAPKDTINVLIDHAVISNCLRVGALRLLNSVVIIGRQYIRKRSFLNQFMDGIVMKRECFLGNKILDINFANSSVLKSFTINLFVKQWKRFIVGNKYSFCSDVSDKIVYQVAP